MVAFSRRSFMSGAASAGCALPLAGACASLSPSPFFSTRGLPLGVQLYTFGDLLRTDLEGTLSEVVRIGYSTVEIPSYMGKSPRELRAALDRTGLRCSSAHVGLRAGTTTEPGLLGDLDALARDMDVIGARHVIAPILTAPDDLKVEAAAGVQLYAATASAMTADHWKRFAARLNAIGSDLKARGLSFGYHNHNIEFVPISGRTAWDLILTETDPELVTFELDVGWVAAAGQDPAEVFSRHPGRYRLMHMKDLKASSQTNMALRMDPTEVGSGRLDWSRILPAAYAAGVREFFLEQEPPFAIPRIEAAARGFAYLNTLTL